MTSRTTWTKEEDDVLRNLYPEMGIKVASYFPHYKRDKIKARASKLGLRREGRGWNDTDLAILRQHYPKVGAKGMSTYLPHRSIMAIKNAVVKWGIRKESYRLWTNYEDRLLQEKYTQYGSNIPELAYRPRYVINQRAAHLGLSTQSGRAPLIHGGAGNSDQRAKEYAIWIGMKNRCLNEKDKAYVRYGGRGIMICNRWLCGEDDKHPYVCFLEDIGLRPSSDHSLERLNVNGNYQPGNVVWADKKAQALNQRRTAKVEFEGETITYHRVLEIDILEEMGDLNASPQEVADYVAARRAARHLSLAT